MRTAILALSLAALTGCGPTDGDPVPDQVEAAPAAPAPEPAAQAQVEAETFVRELYTGIFEDGLSPLSDDQSGLWTPEAWTDIEAAWDRDPAAISVDPFCDCQDPTGMRAGDIDVTLSDPQTATAMVQVVDPRGHFPVTLRLRRLDDGWVIDDILRADGHTFRQDLASGDA